MLDLFQRNIPESTPRFTYIYIYDVCVCVKILRSIGLHGGLYPEQIILGEFLSVLEPLGAKQQGSNVFIMGPGSYRKVEVYE